MRKMTGARFLVVVRWFIALTASSLFYIATSLEEWLHGDAFNTAIAMRARGAESPLQSVNTIILDNNARLR